MDRSAYFSSLAIGANLAIIILALSLKKIWRNNKKKRPDRKWFTRRGSHGLGVLKMVNEEFAVEDKLSYKNFLRMEIHQFDYLLGSIESDIKKSENPMQYTISAKHRLEITLRFLATGESYLKTPSSSEEWLSISKGFNKVWQFPHWLGALDGRHIKLRPPRSDGSYYYNYKGDNSIVLLAFVDANYRFTYINLGCNGRISDGGVFRNAMLSKALDSNALNFPSPTPLPGRAISTPYVFVADDAFPLKRDIMKPYPMRGLSFEQRVFNYRLSRARRIVENAFGILANRFRILLNPINLRVEKVEAIALACVCFHNYLMSGDTTTYLGIENIQFEELPRHSRQAGNKSPVDARTIRDEFKEHFCSQVGRVDWQDTAVNKFNM